MTIEDFQAQLCEHKKLVLFMASPIERVCIRTEQGDHDISGVHQEGSTLIFDMGAPYDVTGRKTDTSVD